MHQLQAIGTTLFMTYRIVLIPGDGIGPEVAEATQRVIEATGLSIEWEKHLAGQAAVDALGSPLPADTLEAVKRAAVDRLHVPYTRRVLTE